MFPVIWSVFSKLSFRKARIFFSYIKKKANVCGVFHNCNNSPFRGCWGLPNKDRNKTSCEPLKIFYGRCAWKGNTCASLSSSCRFLAEMSSIIIMEKSQLSQNLFPNYFSHILRVKVLLGSWKRRELLPDRRHLWCFDCKSLVVSGISKMQNLRHVLGIKLS